MGECVEPTKCAHTCNNDIIELSDTSHDSNLEDDSELNNVGIPPNKVTRQLTFHDLNWKPLKTEEEWLEQRKQLE
ncbi:hypothetical protein BS17DRAFT_778251 [Gyrodon lividus]|nr:hypothetical protein BS17DRAFT_778251 [Gyrodon lividus]